MQIEDKGANATEIYRADDVYFESARRSAGNPQRNIESAN
jgi:hypothetical protein